MAGPRDHTAAPVSQSCHECVLNLDDPIEAAACYPGIEIVEVPLRTAESVDILAKFQSCCFPGGIMEIACPGSFLATGPLLR